MFFLISQVTGLGHSGGDTDIHADVDTHIHVGGYDGGHTEAHSLEGHESPSNSGSSESHSVHPIVTLLGFFGVGKAPLTVIILSWLILWGVSGYACNILFGYSLITISLIVAGIAAVLGTSFLSRIIAKIMPSTETYVQTGLQFWGTEGTVINTLRQTSGTVRIYDRYGNVQDLRCQLLPQQGESIPPGTKVTIDDYDETTGIYTVQVVADHGLEAHN